MSTRCYFSPNVYFIHCPILYDSPLRPEFTAVSWLVCQSILILGTKRGYFPGSLIGIGVIPISHKLACDICFRVNLSHEICDCLKVLARFTLVDYYYLYLDYSRYTPIYSSRINSILESHLKSTAPNS